jgi:hypothetical protein
MGVDAVKGGGDTVDDGEVVSPEGVALERLAEEGSSGIGSGVD